MRQPGYDILMKWAIFIISLLLDISFSTVLSKILFDLVYYVELICYICTL